MRTVAVVQARMSSTRLPGKVMLEVLGKPMILLMLERVARCKRLDDLWLATSEEAADDPLAEAVQKAGYRVFRGSLNDVLSRFWHIARREKADGVVRLTGDCPLHDPSVIDAVVEHFLRNQPGHDYVSNCLPPTYPDGLDTEVFTLEALDEAFRRAESSFDREHVTPYISRRAASAGRTSNFHGLSDFSHLRWTLDQSEDYELIRRVYQDLYPDKADFGWLDVLAWQTRDPERLQINAKYKRNEGVQETTAS
ncbi:MAG: glycosyltransferase family protein [Thermodesulfobacteriota bacterium]